MENPYTNTGAPIHHERMSPTTFAPTAAGFALPVPAAVVAAFAAAVAAAAFTGVRS
jgi:hypothetical protein